MLPVDCVVVGADARPGNTDVADELQAATITVATRSAPARRKRDDIPASKAHADQCTHPSARTRTKRVRTSDFRSLVTLTANARKGGAKVYLCATIFTSKYRVNRTTRYPRRATI